MKYLDYIKNQVEQHFNCDLLDSRIGALHRKEVAIFCKLATSLTLEKPKTIAKLIRLHPKAVNSLSTNSTWKIHNDENFAREYFSLEKICNDFIKLDMKNKRKAIVQRAQSILS